MARKGENIYKRSDGRWEGRYIKGKKPNGRVHFGYVYGHSYQETKDKLVLLKCSYIKEKTTKVSFWGTLSDWTKFWMEDVVQSKIKASTYAYYNSMLQKHILPHLGCEKLIRITSRNIQGFADALQSKGLGANTIHNIIGMLNRVLKAAVRKGALLANPCVDIDLPCREQPQIEAMSKDDQQRLENTALKDKEGIAVMLALYTGMRIGEICGLRWNDIDFRTGTIHVQQTVQRIEDNETGKSIVITGTPKSNKSNRYIPMPQKLFVLLKKEEKKSLSDYVVSCMGHCSEPRTVRYRYQKLAEKAGIRPLHFHGLRHTFATRCIEMDMDIAVISRILGHSSIKMTMDIYLDATLEHKAESIRMLDHIYDAKNSLAL